MATPAKKSKKSGESSPTPKKPKAGKVAAKIDESVKKQPRKKSPTTPSASTPKATKPSGRRAKVSGQAAPGAASAAAETSSSAAPVVAAAAAPAVAVAAEGVDMPFSAALRAGEGFDLASCDPRSTPGFDGSKADGAELLASSAGEISELQERLFAQAKAGGTQRVLLVMQGMDTSGKGGVMRHVVGLVDPQGVDITAFKAPTREERSHPFLWRIRRHLPTPGQLGVFDRSHYEDVLIARVRSLVPASTWARRYGQINTFERTATRDGITIIKVMLHISKDEQGARLAERLERPDKHWKFNPGDIDERALWDDYQSAYQAVLERTSTEHAPWYVVPADRKWFARLAVQQILLEHLRALDPQWPAADFDVDEQRRRLAQS